MKCATCKFFQGGRQCVRHAPVVVPQPDGSWRDVWPTVYPDDGCFDGQPVEDPERWAVVELLGHRRIAGRLSVDYSTGQALARIDVPELPMVRQGRGSCDQGHGTTVEQTYTVPGWSFLFGKGAVYGIEEVSQAKALVAALRSSNMTPEGWEPPAMPVPVCTHGLEAGTTSGRARRGENGFPAPGELPVASPDDNDEDDEDCPV